MSFLDDVHQEALHDWLDERDLVRDDEERPSPAELAEDEAEAERAQRRRL